MENLMNMDDLRVPPILGNLHILGWLMDLWIGDGLKVWGWPDTYDDVS